MSSSATADIVSLVGALAVLAAGVRIMLASWEAPQPGAQPYIISERDRQRHDGQLNIRQVLLTFFGMGLIIWSCVYLLR